MARVEYVGSESVPLLPKSLSRARDEYYRDCRILESTVLRYKKKSMWKLGREFYMATQ